MSSQGSSFITILAVILMGNKSKSHAHIHEILLSFNYKYFQCIVLWQNGARLRFVIIIYYDICSINRSDILSSIDKKYSSCLFVCLLLLCFFFGGGGGGGISQPFPPHVDTRFLKTNQETKGNLSYAWMGSIILLSQETLNIKLWK